MDKLVQLVINTALKSTPGDSFEYLLFYFLQSEEFANICFSHLPTDTMKYIFPGWVMLGIALSEVLQKWLLIAARGEREKHQPEDIAKKRVLRLTMEELINETQRYGGWVFKSCKEKSKRNTGIMPPSARGTPSTNYLVQWFATREKLTTTTKPLALTLGRTFETTLANVG